MREMRMSLTRVKARFDAGIHDLEARRNEWGTLADVLSSSLQEVTDEAERLSLFDKLYVVDSRSYTRPKSPLPSITIKWGNHSVAAATFEDPEKTAVEGGCALTFSQDVRGAVVCIAFPFHSELHSPIEEHLLLYLWKRPKLVRRRHMRCAFRAFLAYSLVGSVFGSPSWLDHVVLIWFRMKDWWRRAEKGKILREFLSSLTSFVGMLKPGV